MATIKLYLRQYGVKSKDGVVWVSFYVTRREKVHFSTKISVSKKDWSEKKQCVSSSDKQCNDKNLILENILARINNVFVKYRLKDKKLSKLTFLRAYNRPDDYDTFFDFFDEYIKKEARRLEGSTLQTHLSVISKIKIYNPELTFDDIDTNWLDDYFCYLMKDLENNQNTAYKNMAVLKKYVSAAVRAGYIEENPFATWKIKKGLPSGDFLTEYELNQLLDLYKNGYLDTKIYKTLEFFLFLCFSSLHVGDAKGLMLEQFAVDTFTYYRIKLKNRKPMPIQVPISDPLRQLIRNVVGTRKKGIIFEHLLAEQTMNRILKDIAVMANIDKTLTMKVGRHTFATIYLRKTKDIASLKEILGHSDLKETLVYAHVLNESKIEGIQCFNGFSL